MDLADVANKNWLVLQRTHTESVHRDKIRKFSHQYTPEGAADLVWLRNTAGLIIKFWPKLESQSNQLLHQNDAQIKAKISGAIRDEKLSRKNHAA